MLTATKWISLVLVLILGIVFKVPLVPFALIYFFSGLWGACVGFKTGVNATIDELAKELNLK